MTCKNCGSSQHQPDHCPRTFGAFAVRQHLFCRKRGGAHNVDACPKPVYEAVAIGISPEEERR